MENDTQNNTKRFTVILDQVGRSILGEVVEETDSTLSLKSPVQIVIGNDKGKLSFQLFPLFFRDLLADKTEMPVFTFKKNLIATSSIEHLDFKVLGVYEAWSKAPVGEIQQENRQQVVEESTENVVDFKPKTHKLFDKKD